MVPRLEWSAQRDLVNPRKIGDLLPQKKDLLETLQKKTNFPMAAMPA